MESEEVRNVMDQKKELSVDEVRPDPKEKAVSMMMFEILVLESVEKSLSGMRELLNAAERNVRRLKSGD